MMAFGEKLPQPLGGLRDRIRRRDADDIETLAPCVGDERFLQKSRLA
jgi:hypothetical protein